MKKIICLLLALMLAFGMVACGGNTDGDNGDNVAVTEGFEATLPAHPAEPGEGATDEEILNYRRDLVVEQMRYHNAVLWTLEEDVPYNLDWDSMGIENDIAAGSPNIIYLKAGRIYRGLPYTHGNNSVHAFSDFFSSVDEKGVYTMSGVTSEHFNANAGLTATSCARLGTDCADAVFWAWAHISPTITFKLTKNMTRLAGCIPVGDYVCDWAVYDQATSVIRDQNGRDVMMESYAKMQKGDGMVFINKNIQGHAVMCVGVNVVRNEDGSINSRDSYAIILEQQSGGERDQQPVIDEATGLEVYPLDGIDVQWSFDYLYERAYLPVTCQELIDPSPLPEPEVIDSLTDITAKTMFKGKITATRPIASVTLKVVDSNGNVVQKATAYVTSDDLPGFNLMRFSSDVEKAVMHGSYDLGALKPGEYKCVFTALLGDGSEIEFRNVPYTVEAE